MDSTTGSGGRWLALIAGFLGWFFAGFVMGMYPIIARPALASLLGGADDTLIGAWNGWITACFLLGAAAGGALFGWLGDRIGRVRAMALSIFTYAAFMGLKAFATEPWHLAALRFASSLGMGGEWALGVALVMECWPEKLRPMLAGVLGASANFGFLLVAFLGTQVDVTVESWRWMPVVGAAPVLLAAFVALCVPESERWKAAVRGGHSRPIHEIFARGLRKSTLLAIVFASIPLIGTWAAVSGWLPVWADQLTGGKVPNAKAMTQVMISIGAIIGCFVAPIVGGRIGRRPAYFALCLLSLVFTGYQFRFLHAYGVQFLVLSGIVGCVTAAFYGWLPLYLPELFPTRVRATGQGLSFNFGRILAAAGAVQMGQLVGLLGGYARAGATITLIYVLGLILIWFAPETKGKPLPE